MATAEQNERINELVENPRAVVALLLEVADEGTVAKSDEMAKNSTVMRANVAGLAAGQADIRKTLDAQGDQLTDHGRQLADHGRQLTDHGRQLSALHLGVRMMLEASATPEQLRLFDEAAAAQPED